jgi:ubiquinone/menaquinone biosynthesis C-methylase UbiE
MEMHQEDATKKLWSKVAKEKAESSRWELLSWDAHPIVKRYINRRISGDPEISWLPFVKQRFFPKPVQRGLSLGCGWGNLERDAVSLDICMEFDAYDIAPGAIEVAREEAAKRGLSDVLHYHCADLNVIELPPGRYDVCFAAASLHHISKLDQVLSQVQSALRESGLLVMLEYVGPTRYQWSRKVEAFMNALLKAFPESHKISLRDQPIIKGEIRRPKVKDVISADPSEAIRSEEILSLLSKYFTIKYQANFGGTLLQFVLADIVGNFKIDDPKDIALLNLAILFEEILMDEGVISSDFVFLVAKPI